MLFPKPSDIHQLAQKLPSIRDAWEFWMRGQVSWEQMLAHCVMHLASANELLLDHACRELSEAPPPILSGPPPAPRSRASESLANWVSSIIEQRRLAGWAFTEAFADHHDGSITLRFRRPELISDEIPKLEVQRPRTGQTREWRGDATKVAGVERSLVDAAASAMEAKCEREVANALFGDLIEHEGFDRVNATTAAALVEACPVCYDSGFVAGIGSPCPRGCQPRSATAEGRHEQLEQPQ